MSKYIDADMLEKDGWNMQRIRQVSSTEMVYETKKPTDFPVADVVEVKHGRWVDMWFCSNYSGYDYGMNCSVCGKPMHRQLAEKMPPFCPNCGASMDEVTE